MMWPIHMRESHLGTKSLLQGRAPLQASPEHLSPLEGSVSSIPIPWGTQLGPGSAARTQ